MSEVSNNITGDYVRSGPATEIRSVTESGSDFYVAFRSSDNEEQVWSGNGVTQSGNESEQDSQNTTLTESGSSNVTPFGLIPLGGSVSAESSSSGATGYSLKETSTLTSVMHTSANSISGSYTSAGYSQQHYNLSQTETPAGGGALTIVESGLVWSETAGSGAGLVGSGTTTTTSSEQYTLDETGTDSAGAVAISVAGLSNSTTVEVRQARTGSLSESITGTDVYNRTMSGSPDSGKLDWSESEGGNAVAGALGYTQETGDTRYNLIVDFVPAATEVRPRPQRAMPLEKIPSRPTFELPSPVGWHVDYDLTDDLSAGGGPHYVIHPNTGASWPVGTSNRPMETECLGASSCFAQEGQMPWNNLRRKPWTSF